MLPVPISIVLSFVKGHPVAAYVFFLVFTLLLSFPLSLHKMRPIQSACRIFAVCRIFISSLTVYNASSFLTRSVQFIFSITTFQKFPGVSDLLSEVPTFQHRRKMWSKRSKSLVSFYLLVNDAFALAILELISHYILKSLSCYATHIYMYT